MKTREPIGLREYPCPEYTLPTLEEAIQQQLEEHDETTVQAFLDYCDDRIDDFLEHEANRRREHADEIRRDAA